MPLPSSHGSNSSSSTSARPRSDRMKDSILKESSAGWTGAVTPLRIAKRDQFSPSSSSPNPSSVDPTHIVARRSSNSYKHMFNNNLVSRSPFKTQPGPRQQPSSASNARPLVPVTRKVSGEKRPRPVSLVQQAEREDAQRVTELGYKRRQSRGFQGLVEKGPVSKSPFLQLVSPGRGSKEGRTVREEVKQEEEEVDLSAPIAIQFPTKEDDISPETTETNSSLSSRGSIQNEPSEPRPRTPPVQPTPPRISPSPGFERRSPLPSALQGSPARSSLVQKSRLLGPRSRSLSAGANGTPVTDPPPRRERRKTVTFDERCDVVEFDRDSCEDAVFDTDDEDVYGPPEFQQASSQEVSLDASDYFDATELNDSINGLVESMLKEATNVNEPSTPENQSASLSSIVSDVDMMTGGAEEGVPLGRTHHAERARAHRHEEPHSGHSLPAIFHVGDHASSIPRQEPENAEPQTPRPFATPKLGSCEKTELPSLPVDAELDEDGIPLGRSHHAQRARAAHQASEELDVEMLPASPSPVKDVASNAKQELPDPLVPKFDLHLADIHTSSPRGPAKERGYSNEDVFGPLDETSGLLGKLDFEYGNEGPDLSVNTSVASFHEFPPQEVLVYGNNEDEKGRGTTPYAQEISLGARLDVSGEVIDSDLHLCEDQGKLQPHAASDQEHGWKQMDAKEGEMPEDPNRSEPHASKMEQEAQRLASPVVDHDPNSDHELFSPRLDGLYTQREVGSASSLVGSDDRRSMSPRINREDILRKISRRRSSDNYSPLGTPPLVSSVSSMPKLEEVEREDTKMEVEEELSDLPPPPSQIDSFQPRPSLEERLKRALSPSLPAPAPVRPAIISSTSPALPSPSASPHVPAPATQTNVIASPNAPDTPISSPPRLGKHARARTYDLDERSPSAPAKIGARRSPMSSSFDFNKPGVDIGDMDMRSALERLVDDVSIASGVEPASLNNSARTGVDAPADGDISMTDTELMTEESTDLLAYLRDNSVRSKPPIGRAGTAPLPTLPKPSTPDRFPLSRTVSEVSMVVGSSAAGMLKRSTFTAPTSEPVERRMELETDVPPPLPPKASEKSARKAREEMIREKRREARMRESGEYFVPPRRDAAGNLIDESPAGRRRSGQQPSTGRSMSTGDAEDLMSESPAAQRRVSVLRHRRGGVLGVDLDNDDGMLSQSIQRELNKRDDPKKTYELREHGAVVYATSSQEAALAQVDESLDIDDKAWRTVRRPSDMNEYANEIRAIRAQEKPGRSNGRVFVKVLRLRSLTVPIPPQLTFFSLTLNNGIHFVTTPDCRFSREPRIEQEFELLEHGKLEFTLTIKIRKDPHILQQLSAIVLPPIRPQTAAPSPTQHRGMRSFFGGRSKAPKPTRPQAEPVVREIEENLARYMKQDGTLARAFIDFKDIAKHCEARLFEIAFPLIGQRLEAPGEGDGAGGKIHPLQVGEIILQIFRLPPLPGLSSNQLPQSIEECIRGIRNSGWHKVTYHEGVLTQLGGDCSTWRRRQLRVIGGSLVAFNDITKRATATIDLKKAIAIEDDQDPENVAKRRDVDDFDSMYGVERSFRLIFPHNQEITFFADTDEEKYRWLEVLRALVSHIPPNPLWAELLWQKQNESKGAEHPQPSSSTMRPS